MDLADLINNSTFIKSVKSGNAHAQHQLGELALKACRTGIAIRLFKCAAQQGHVDAHLQLMNINKIIPVAH